MSEYTASFSGYMPTGLKTYFTIELDGTDSDFDKVLAYQNSMLSRGLTLHEPGVGDLEPGEKTDSVGYVIRYDKENKRGTISHWIGLYPDSDQATKKYLWVYLDTPEQITAFEEATGVKVASMKVWPTNQAPERTPAMMDYIVKVKPGTLAVYKPNPDWISEEKTKFEPKRIFVRWANATPTPPAPKPAVENPTPVIADDWEAEARREAVARFDNETVTIFKVTYQPTHNGSGKPCWEAMVQANDLSKFPITLWQEHVNTIRKAGYTFPTADAENLVIDIVIEVVDGKQRMKAAVAPDGTIIPVVADKPAKTNPERIAWIFDKPMLFTALGKRPEVAKIDYKERANTVNKMHTEGAFDAVADVEEAASLVVARLMSHRTEKKTA